MECFDVAAEFSQRVKPFRRAGARIAHEIIETVFPGDDDKMRDAITQPHAHDHGISVRDVRIDQLIRGQIFIHVAHPIGCKPRRTVPVKPPLVRESARRSQEPVQLLRIDIDPVKLEHHRRRRHGAAFAAQRAVLGNAA